MIEITKDTKPTLETTKTKLTGDHFKLTKNKYSVQDLGQQFFHLLPLVYRYRDLFKEKGFPEVETKLIEGHRLAELGGYYQAERVSLNALQIAASQKQKQLRQDLVANRDAAVRLARDRDVDSRLFSVNVGQGDASHVLVPANVFHNLLERHGDKLNLPTVVNEILVDTERIIAELTQAEIEQETKKKEQLVPTGLKRKARWALYEILLHFSRIGFVLLRHNPEIRSQFSLRTLRNGRSVPVVADDDDAPMAPLVPDASGVNIPQGNVAEVAAGVTGEIG